MTVLLEDLGVAMSEMAISGDFGAVIYLLNVPMEMILGASNLFSESHGRYLNTIKKMHLM